MSRKLSGLPLLLLMLLVSAGCGPRSRQHTAPPVRSETPTPDDSSSYDGGYQQAGQKTRVIDWHALEARIPNLDQRTDQALTLIEKAFDLKKKYDEATGDERSRLKAEVSRVYAQAGDIYDEIINDVDTIEMQEKIDPTKDGSLMSRGLKLRKFAGLWEKRSKPIKRMGF